MIALPYHTLPSHTIPRHTSPDLTKLYLTRPNQTRLQPTKLRPYRKLFHKGMLLFVTAMTACLEISGVIGSVLRKWQNVMAMGFFIMKLIFAVLTESFVTLIDKLLKRSPQIKRQSFVPVEPQPWKLWNCEINSHTLPNPTSPYRISPNPTVPFLTTKGASPNLTQPFLASLYITGPGRTNEHQTTPYHKGLTILYLTLPHLAALNPTRPILTTKGTPYHTLPYPTAPNITSLDLATPNLAPPFHTTRLGLLDLKASNHKAPELGTKVTDSGGSTSQLQDFINNVVGNLVIQYGDFKIQFPASLKAGPDLNNPRPLDNHGPDIQVKPLISIGIQILRGLNSVKNNIRGNKDIALKKVFIGFTSCALNLVSTSGLNHRPIKVGSWLVNIAFRGDVQKFTPHLGIVLLPCFDLPALAQGFKVWERESVLQKWGNTFNANENGVHSYFFLSLAKRAKYSSIARRICSERLNPFKAFRASLCFSVMYKFILIIQTLYTYQMYMANIKPTVGRR